mgnify:CR=1 FL=1
MHTHVCIPQEKTESDVYIFLEYVSGGSISQMLRKFGAFSETMVGNFTAQIVDGLDYLHAQGYVGDGKRPKTPAAAGGAAAAADARGLERARHAAARPRQCCAPQRSSRSTPPASGKCARTNVPACGLKDVSYGPSNHCTLCA